ncbi:MAG: glycosyl transferase family protein, partial [uncultured bacterium]
MKVSVVIPNYNGAELLERNLPKVIQVCKNCEIIVVDDASIDGSIKEIKNQIAKIKNTYKKSKIRLLQNEKNLGFASTVNRGVDEASGDLVVLLNTDVIPEKEFLQPSVKHFSNPQVFAVGFLQKCPENGKIIERGRGIGKFQQGFLIHARGAVSRKDTSEVVPMRSGTPQTVEESKKTLWVSGGAGILRKSIW